MSIPEPHWRKNDPPNHKHKVKLKLKKNQLRAMSNQPLKISKFKTPKLVQNEKKTKAHPNEIQNPKPS